LNLQQLEYFLASFDRGSFSAAAEALHLAQPSVSEQVRSLEAELGVQLFARVGRGLKPTEAGRELRPHAERVLHAVEAARESVVAVRELRGGTAAFGIWGHARFYPGMDIVAEFRTRHPNVRVRLLGLNSAEVVDALRSGDLEAGMVALPIDDRGLDVRPITRDEIVYVSTDPARLKGRVDIRRLAAAPLILADASYGADDPTRRQLAELAQRAGVTIEPQIDVEDIESALSLVEGGLRRHHRVAWRAVEPGLAPVQAHRLDAVRPADLRHVRVRVAPRLAAVPGRPRVSRAGRGAADGPRRSAQPRRAPPPRPRLRMRGQSPQSHHAARWARPSAYDGQNTPAAGPPLQAPSDSPGRLTQRFQSSR
jgi:DNA-binding transcriptional LysR family regulator